MLAIVGLLFLFVFIMLIVGLIKPTIVARKGEIEKRNRKQVLLICVPWLVILFSAMIIMAPSSQKESDNTAVSTQASSSKPQPKEEPSVKSYKPGQYKVGADIPAGEYVGISNGEAYIEVAKNATGTLDSIITNDIFQNRTIITISNGQFVKLQNCQLYAFNDAPKTKKSNGFLPSGMYKVGVDIPAGEYKVTSEGGDSYIELSNSSTHILEDIISNDIFTGDKYTEIADGQYINLKNAKIKLN